MEFQQWLNNPVTVALFNKLTKAKEDAKEDWAKERYMSADSQSTSNRNAYALGGVALVDQILSMTVEDL